MGNFIKTEQETVANELRASGYPELGKEGKFFVFANIGKKINFTEDDKKNMVFTNVVCL